MLVKSNKCCSSLFIAIGMLPKTKNTLDDDLELLSPSILLKILIVGSQTIKIKDFFMDRIEKENNFEEGLR